MKTTKLRIAILASGSGSNLGAILQGCRSEKVNATPVAVLSNNPEAFALERARNFDVPDLVANHQEFHSRKAHEEEIISLLEPFQPDLLVLAGYMRVITPRLINVFHGRKWPGIPGVMNIHPADTKLYQGAHGYEFALGLLPEHPKRLCQTKITVHFVDAGIDTGSIIAQRDVPIFQDDTLEELRERGLEIEHRLYPECIELYVQGRL